jgi:hypothetical protein
MTDITSVLQCDCEEKKVAVLRIQMPMLGEMAVYQTVQTLVLLDQLANRAPQAKVWSARVWQSRNFTRPLWTEGLSSQAMILFENIRLASDWTSLLKLLDETDTPFQSSLALWEKAAIYEHFEGELERAIDAHIFKGSFAHIS